MASMKRDNQLRRINAVLKEFDSLCVQARKTIQFDHHAPELQTRMLQGMRDYIEGISSEQPTPRQDEPQAGVPLSTPGTAILTEEQEALLFEKAATVGFRYGWGPDLDTVGDLVQLNHQRIFLILEQDAHHYDEIVRKLEQHQLHLGMRLRPELVEELKEFQCEWYVAPIAKSVQSRATLTKCQNEALDEFIGLIPSLAHHRTALHRQGIYTVGELCQRSLDQLQGSGINFRGRRVITFELATMRLALGMTFTAETREEIQNQRVCTQQSMLSTRIEDGATLNPAYYVTLRDAGIETFNDLVSRSSNTCKGLDLLGKQLQLPTSCCVTLRGNLTAYGFLADALPSGITISEK